MNRTFLALTFAAVMASSLRASAQSNVFTRISYQGNLNILKDDFSGTSPVDGRYDFRYGIVIGPLDPDNPWRTNCPNCNTTLLGTNSITVNKGLFTTTLLMPTGYLKAGFMDGTNVFLEFAVRTNGGGAFTTLEPLQPLSATPYAVVAQSVSGPISATSLIGSLPAAALGGSYGNPLSFLNPQNVFAGEGSLLANVNATTLGGFGPCNLPCYWKLTGNDNATASSFLGTATGNNNWLEMRVNGKRALRLIPDDYSPNILGGSPANSIDPGSRGSVIAGGGGVSDPAFEDMAPNRIVGTNYYEFIGGGFGNSSSGGRNVIGGGQHNTMSGANSCVIGGGHLNLITSPVDSGAICGGQRNTVTGGIPGGAIQADVAFIGAGHDNTATNLAAFIGAGGFNLAGGAYSVVTGGTNNRALGESSVVAGGQNNFASGYLSAIGGGIGNNNTANYTTIGGGFVNLASGQDAVVAGGSQNSATAGQSTVGGGILNHAKASQSTVAGGALNQASGVSSAIGGGSNNVASGLVSTVAGGQDNLASGQFSTVSGGSINMASGSTSLAAGYRAKAMHDGTYVWGDSQSADFASTANNQYLIRAAGGVGIGTTTPVMQLHVQGDTRVTGVFRSGSETGTSLPPSPAGLVVRRINSTSAALNQVVARNDHVTLERDGSNGGMIIRYPAGTSHQVIACTAMTSAGTQLNFYTTLVGGPGSTSIYYNATNVVQFHCTFGDSFNSGHHTEVNMIREGTDFYWVGTLTSTYNQ